MRNKRPVFEIDYSTRAGTLADAWVPYYSADRVTWTAGTLLEKLTSPKRVRFQFNEAFSSDAVYVADKPVFGTLNAQQLAASLLASGASVSSVANASGVIRTTVAVNNDVGDPAGGNDMYGFILQNATAPTLGARKRELVVTCGIHAGEVEDGWFLRGIVDYWRYGVGADADQFRSDWRVCVYFMLNPDGRRAGNARNTQTVGVGDPNRDWVAFVSAENRAVRDAILADATYHDAHFDLHSTEGEKLENAFKRPTLPAAMYTAFKSYFDSITGASLSLSDSVADATVGEWAEAQGAQFVLVTEPGSNMSRTVAQYAGTGEAYARALMSIHRSGYISG